MNTDENLGVVNNISNAPLAMESKNFAMNQITAGANKRLEVQDSNKARATMLTTLHTGNAGTSNFDTVPADE